MDIKRFNERMGKLHKFSKGGHVGRRRYFDVGGPVSPPPGGASVLPGATSTVQGSPVQTTGGGVVNAIGSALGTNNNFQAAGTNIQAGTTAGQIQDAYTGAQGALAAQTGQVAALTPQVASAVNAQNTLQGQYANQAAGLGPNVAGAQLSQATGQNVANTAALQAGQRGASSNVGLIAREAGQQGAATQQAATGQAVTLEQQQEIAAQQNQANLAAAQIAQSQNAANTATAAQNTEQNTLQGANTALNTVNEQATAAQNATNAGVSEANQKNNAGILGGIAGGLSSALGFEYRGGEVAAGPHDSHVANYMYADGGETKSVKAMVSPGEIYLSPDQVKKVVEEGANPLKIGKKVLGKPKVKGDSLKNDTVPADLEEGGVVIPRHIMNKKDSEKAELFVRRAVHMRAPKGA